MMLTVGICTWNRAALLHQTLAQLRQVRVPEGVDWELFVINNRCTDDTDAVIESHRAHLPLTRLWEAEPGLSNARNRGMVHARGEVILWIDDDVLVSPDWLAAAAEGARAYPEAAGFAGPITPWFPAEPDPDLLAAFPALKNGFCGLDLGTETREMTSAEFAYGANMAFRSTWLKDLQFDPVLGPKGEQHGSGDDTEYQRKIKTRGGTFVWLPQMGVKHYVAPERMTLAYLASYSFGSGGSAIRCDGVPQGRQLLGAPRFLYRQAAEQYAGFLYNRARGRRAASLDQWRKYHYYRGMIQACRTLARPLIAPGGMTPGGAS